MTNNSKLWPTCPDPAWAERWEQARPVQGDWSRPVSVCPQVSVSTEQENEQKENTLLASEITSCFNFSVCLFFNFPIMRG